MTRHTTLKVLTALACACAATANAETFRVELEDPAAPAQLQVEIQWGSIQVVGSAEATALTIKAVPDQPDEIAGSLIAVSEKDNLVTVRQAALTSGSFRSANVTIIAPSIIALELTVHRGGDILVRDIAGLVEVTNLNGSVELAGLSQAAAVNASNGSISVGFTRPDPNRDMLFTSLNGSVEICLPSSFSGKVDLTTAGDPIRSEFQIDRVTTTRTVSPGDSVTPKQSKVIGSIGTGQATLRASTLNGEIALRICEP